MQNLFLLLVSLAGSFAYGLDESTLPAAFESIAIPYLETVPSQVMITPDNVKIAYRYFPSKNPIGTIVIVNGRTEFMRKYAELVYDLRNSGYSIFLYDHRGQGESQRLLPASLSQSSYRGFVNRYEDYVGDLAQLMSQKVIPMAGSGDIFFLTHSMGGAVAAAYVFNHPSTVTAMVACSPMIAPNIGPFTQDEGLAVEESAVDLGFGADYAPGKGPGDWATAFANNVVTNSAARYADEEGEYQLHPELIVAGPTNQWVREAIRIGQFVSANAEKLTIPALIYQAGHEDVVLPGAETDFANRATNATVVQFPDAYHEILMEKDATRNRAVQTALDFFQQHRTNIEARL